MDARTSTRIGTAFGEPSQELYGIVGAGRLVDGSIALGLQGTHEIRIFGSDGAFDRSVGRKGDGPGEFRELAWIDVLAGDTLLAWDNQGNRLSRFASDGTFLGSETYEGRGVAVGRLADGSVLLRSRTSGPIPSITSVREDSAVYAVAASASAASDDRSRRIFATVGERLFFHVSPQGFLVLKAPFRPEPRIAVASNGIWVAWSDQPRADFLDSGGRMLRSIRWSPDALPVTPGVRESYIETVREEYEPEVANPSFLRALDALPFPDRLPETSGLLLDALDRLWIRRGPIDPAEPSTWRIFTRDGHWISDVILPPGLEPIDVGEEYLIGVRTDVLGVETVEVMPLRR